MRGVGLGVRVGGGRRMGRARRTHTPRPSPPQADSLDEVEAQLARRGVPFVRQVVVEEGIEVQQLFFHDPDNNMIEVCVWVGGGGGGGGGGGVVCAAEGSGVG